MQAFFLFSSMTFFLRQNTGMRQMNDSITTRFFTESMSAGSICIHKSLRAWVEFSERTDQSSVLPASKVSGRLINLPEIP